VRACYAALAIQRAMQVQTAAARGAHGVEVSVRVGLNSGEVLVRAIGNDLSMDYDAIGQTVHLASRMEQLASPGTIRLTAATANGHVPLFTATQEFCDVLRRFVRTGAV
jgi:class 3 adenylate cyclase